MELDPVLAALSRLEAGQASIVAHLASVDARLTSMDARLTSFDARLTGLETGQIRMRTELMERMDRMENKINALRDDVVVNFGSYEAVRRVNDNTREELRNLGDLVSAIHRKVQRLETQIQNIEDH